MIPYRAMPGVPAELLRYLTRLLAAERRRRGTPARSRKLTCRGQAVLALRWFRDRTRIEALGRDHGVSRATACRYVAEAVDVLSAQAPGLAEALERALAEGVPYVILDGKVFAGDRCAEEAVSVLGKDTGAWYSGKNHCHGATARPSCAPTGSRCGPARPTPARPATSPEPAGTPSPSSTASPPAGCPCWPTQATPSRHRHRRPFPELPGKARPRPRRPLPQRAAARTALPGRTRLRPAHPALGRPPAHHRQPQQDHRDNPRRPRPDPIRAQIHQVKLAEITSLRGTSARPHAWFLSI